MSWLLLFCAQPYRYCKRCKKKFTSEIVLDYSTALFFRQSESFVSANDILINKISFLTRFDPVPAPNVHLLKQKQKTIMKTKSLFIAALVVFSSAVAFAGKDEPRKTGLAIVPVKNEVFKVIFKSESTGRIKLNIYNENGTVVFTDTVYGVDGFIRPLNFSGMRSGNYTIELVDASGKKAEKVSYQPKAN
jgi:hypothetical protein